MPDIVSSQQRLLATIDAAISKVGFPAGVRPSLRDAFFAVPRHAFVDRYQVMRGGPVLELLERDLTEHLNLIYRDVGLGHVDQAGQPVPSVNSPPSHVFHMLELLDLKPGQSVLEIGSGCGWLLGLAARMVGPQGSAVGIEIIADLARQSQKSLDAVGLANARAVAADGAAGWEAGAPFDRVIFTAGMWSLPLAFFDQVRDGGLLVAPFQIKGGCNDLLVLRKLPGRRFRSVAIIPALFVDVTGGISGLDRAPSPLQALPLWQELAQDEVLRMPMGFGMGALGGMSENLFGWRTAAFRSFLAKLDPRFMTFTPDLTGMTEEMQVLFASGMGAETIGFGLGDTRARSLAVCTGGELVGYGSRATATDLLAVYREWADLMMPGAEAFEADLVPAADAPPPGPGCWVEQRGDVAFLWTLRGDRARASNAFQMAAE